MLTVLFGNLGIDMVVISCLGHGGLLSLSALVFCIKLLFFLLIYDGQFIVYLI